MIIVPIIITAIIASLTLSQPSKALPYENDSSAKFESGTVNRSK